MTSLSPHQKDVQSTTYMIKDELAPAYAPLDHYRHKTALALFLSPPSAWPSQWIGCSVSQSIRLHWVSFMWSGWCQALSELCRTGSSGWLCQEVASCWTASPVEVFLLYPCSMLHFQRITQPTKILAKSQSLFRNIRQRRSERTTGCGGPWWLENRSSGLTWRSSSPTGESFLMEVGELCKPGKQAAGRPYSFYKKTKLGFSAAWHPKTLLGSQRSGHCRAERIISYSIQWTLESLLCKSNFPMWKMPFALHTW